MLSDGISEIAAAALLLGAAEHLFFQEGASAPTSREISSIVANEKLSEIVSSLLLEKENTGEKQQRAIVQLVRFASLVAGNNVRPVQGESSKGSLSSVFNLLFDGERTQVFAPGLLTSAPNTPTDEPNHPARFSHVDHSPLRSALCGWQSDPTVSGLLEILENHLSYTPYRAAEGQPNDLSIAEHARLTAAIASALSVWCQSQQVEDYGVFAKDTSFQERETLRLLTLDISGIQRFIYRVSSKGALKALRARSFYLELLLQHVVDEILETCGLPASNLLYVGGGHAYMLFPNVPDLFETIDCLIRRMNRQLLQSYGTDLFIAHGSAPLSIRGLRSSDNAGHEYTAAFQVAASAVSVMKLRRYSADDVRLLADHFPDSSGRECSVCGASNVRTLESGEDVCSNCASFLRISSALTQQDAIFIITPVREQQDDPVLPSPHDAPFGLVVLPLAAAQQKLHQSPASIHRAYFKNLLAKPAFPARRLWMGDLTARDQSGAVVQFSDFAKWSAGIQRIGVLRADVDDLGLAFTHGFVRTKGPDSGRYLSLARTNMLSRQLSLFFKLHVNAVLASPHFALPDVARQDSGITIVYSGGDDVFVVGPWQEVLCAAIDLRHAFHDFTGGALTLSAGVGIFDEKYPLAQMAAETAALEEVAKAHVYQGGAKNSVSLYGMEADESAHMLNRHTYTWDVLEKEVLGEKYAMIAAAIAARPQELGSAFLYSLLALLRRAQEDRLNVARLAYLLARRECPPSSPRHAVDTYDQFKRKVYQWALSSKDRAQLISALMTYVYSHRLKEE